MASDSQIKEDLSLKLTKKDHAHTAVRALVSAIPIVGSPFEIVFSKLYPSPIDKRRDKLLESVTEGIEQLKQKHEDLTPEALTKNELFVSVLLQAVTIAIRNHQDDKYEALRNAVLNTALKININENMQMTFLHYIDDLTPLHLKIVKLFESPRRYLEEVGRTYAANVTGTTLAHLIEHAIPELHKSQENIRVLYSDCYNYHLVNTKPEVLGTFMSVGDNGLFAQRTTDVAREFLRYITKPRELKA